MKTDTVETKFIIKSSRIFNKNLKKAIKQGKDINKLKDVLKHLANKEPLAPKYRDHCLIDDKYYKNCRECHIEPDWLLIYQYVEDELFLLLLNIGSHSALF